MWRVGIKVFALHDWKAQYIHVNRNVPATPPCPAPNTIPLLYSHLHALNCHTISMQASKYDVFVPCCSDCSPRACNSNIRE